MALSVKQFTLEITTLWLQIVSLGPKVDSFRDLNLILNLDMKFRRHVQFVRTKSLRLIGYFVITFHSSLPPLYVRFYLSYIIPIINYSVIFYVNLLKSSLTIVESIKHVFTRRLFVRCYRSHSIPPFEERLKLFGWNKLSLRFVAIGLFTLYKLSRGMLLGIKIIQFSERLLHRIILNPINSSLMRNSLFHRAFSVWNKVIKSNPSDFDGFQTSFLYSTPLS